MQRISGWCSRLRHVVWRHSAFVFLWQFCNQEMVVLSSLFFKEIERMALEAADVCLRRVLKENNKRSFDSYSRQEQCIDHIPYYLSGLSRAHFCRQPFLIGNSCKRFDVIYAQRMSFRQNVYGRTSVKHFFLVQFFCRFFFFLALNFMLVAIIYRALRDTTEHTFADWKWAGNDKVIFFT